MTYIISITSRKTSVPGRLGRYSDIEEFGGTRIFLDISFETQKSHSFVYIWFQAEEMVEAEYINK